MRSETNGLPPNVAFILDAHGRVVLTFAPATQQPPANTTGYSAGRVCFRGPLDALSARCRGSLDADSWWPGCELPDRYSAR